LILGSASVFAISAFLFLSSSVSDLLPPLHVRSYSLFSHSLFVLDWTASFHLFRPSRTRSCQTQLRPTELVPRFLAQTLSEIFLLGTFHSRRPGSPPLSFYMSDCLFFLSHQPMTILNKKKYECFKSVYKLLKGGPRQSPRRPLEACLIPLFNPPPYPLKNPHPPHSPLPTFSFRAYWAGSFLLSVVSEATRPFPPPDDVYNRCGAALEASSQEV